MVKKDRLSQIIMHIFMILLAVLCLLPFLLILVSSLTEETMLVRNGYSFFPEKWSLETYYYLLQSGMTILKGYGMTVLTTVVGTTISLIITTLLAYPLSQKATPCRRFFSFVVFFTMLFNGGTVSTFMVYTNIFHIRNTFWALVIPNLLMSAYYVVLMRSYFVSSIPESLIEASQLDGAGELRILLKVVIPLAKPILATVALMIGLSYWNDWTNGLYYVTDSNLYTIQLILNNMISNVKFLASSANTFGGAVSILDLPSVGIRMGIAVISIVPVLCIYPFFQKYFVKGIIIGGIKG